MTQARQKSHRPPPHPTRSIYQYDTRFLNIPASTQINGPVGISYPGGWWISFGHTGFSHWDVKYRIRYVARLYNKVMGQKQENDLIMGEPGLFSQGFG